MGRQKGSKNKPVATPEAIGHCFDCGRPSVTLICDDCLDRFQARGRPEPRAGDRRWNGVGYARGGTDPVE